MSNESTADRLIRLEKIFTDPEYSPEPIPTLVGGDGEGIYVVPRRYVQIEVGPRVDLRLTPDQARKMAADLIAASDAVEVSW